MNYYLTIDLGATKTLVALFDKNGRIIKSTRFPSEHDFNSFSNKLITHLTPLQKYPIANITFAICGLVEHGSPTLLRNLDWNNPPLYNCIKILFNCPVYFLNDADAATYYESKYYSGHVMYLTFSTGLGGGLAIDKTLITESSAFEPGETLVEWKDKTVRWTTIASARALGEAYNSRVSNIHSLRTLHDLSLRLTTGLTPLILKYQPDVIIFGGAVGYILNRFRLLLAYDLRKSIAKSKGIPTKKVRLPHLARAKKPLRSTTFGAFLYGREH
ncbi:MAG: ROK family protein [Candidatus Saccharibacteria bacterium]|nr:ROK family protein [Candidatus Saccharibacteria bacterium]